MIKKQEKVDEEKVAPQEQIYFAPNSTMDSNQDLLMPPPVISEPPQASYTLPQVQQLLQMERERINNLE